MKITDNYHKEISLKEWFHGHLPPDFYIKEKSVGYASAPFIYSKTAPKIRHPDFDLDQWLSVIGMGDPIAQIQGGDCIIVYRQGYLEEIKSLLEKFEKDHPHREIKLELLRWGYNW